MKTDKAKERKMSKSFDEILQEIVNLDDEDKVKMAVDCYIDLLPRLAELDSEHCGLFLTYAILGTVCVADGVLSQAEFEFVDGLLSAIGIEKTRGEIIDIISKAADDDTIIELVTALPEYLDDEQTNTLANFVAAISSLDDRISSEEVAFIKALIS